ncbi:helix-turn-helix domain-containing protein [Acidiphilium sp.]|uniref:helix-turn-helix domain-containing protein n=1 Tax=Acidiphilium sp. TaxID=527 RepID=UPI00258AF727|nr:helix-turn-helix domain-containing protein [Acidiphilium sp.]
MPSRILTDQQIDTAIDLRLKARSVPQIAARLGVKPNTIDYHLRRLGVFPPGWRHKGPKQAPAYQRGTVAVRPFTPEEDAMIERLDLEGLGISAIGRQLGRKPNSVRARLVALANRQACEED